MRKALLSLFIACMGLLPCYAAPGDGGAIKLPVQDLDRGKDHGPRPLVPPAEGVAPPDFDYQEYVYVMYDPEAACLSFITPKAFPVLIVLSNIDTGETLSYSFYISRDMTIPFMGGEGKWRIRLTGLAPGSHFGCTGCFYFDNGMIY